MTPDLQAALAHCYISAQLYHGQATSRVLAMAIISMAESGCWGPAKGGQSSMPS